MKKATLMIAVPGAGMTVARMLRTAPKGSVALPATAAVFGERLSATAGPVLAPTVTLTTAEVAVALFESVTRAVSDTVATAVGVHVAVYGALVAVPTSVAPAKKST